MQKIIFILTIKLLILSNVYGQQGCEGGVSCPNGNIENGDFTNFKQYIGTSSYYLNLSSFSLGTSFSGPWPNQRHEIMPFSPWWDVHDPLLLNTPSISLCGPHNPIEMPVVLKGSHSIRLGTPDAGNEAEILSYNFCLNSDTTLTFSWASVQSFGYNHDYDCADCPNGILTMGNPFFKYWISKTDDLLTSIDVANYIEGKMYQADVLNPFWNILPWGGCDILYPYDTPDGVVYKKWHQECIDLSDYSDLTPGDNLTIFFASGDCDASQHFGYVYLDNICTDEVYPCFNIPDEICSDYSLIADVECSSEAVRHRWEITKLNSNDPNDEIIGSGIWGLWFYNNITDIEDITFLLNAVFSWGYGYYRIDLVLEKCDGTLIRYPKVIHILDCR